MINNSEKNGGVGCFAEVLALIFVILKLCHVIEWSWIWVLSPLWISSILYIVFLFLLYHLFK